MKKTVVLMRGLGVHHPKKEMIRDHEQFHPPPPSGGCGLLPKILTLFMEFSQPHSLSNQKFDTLFKT